MVLGDGLQEGGDTVDLVVMPVRGTPDVLLERLGALAERAGLKMGLAEAPAPLPDEACHMVLFYRSAALAIAEAVGDGAVPSAALEEWIAQTDAMLAIADELGSAASLVDVAAPGPGLDLLARVLGAEPPEGEAMAAPESADPVLLALAGAALAGSESARRLTARIAAIAGPGATPEPATDPDAAFARYRALLSQSVMPEPAGLGTEAGDHLKAELAELAAERDALLEQLAETQDALVASYTEHRVLRRQVIALGREFSNPAFYGLEHVSPERPFRWFGREAEAFVPTLVACDRPVRVTVHIELAVSDMALDGFEIGADGVYAEETTTERLANGSFHKSAVIPARETESRYTRLALSLRARERKDMEEFGDPRTLSVGVSSITVAELGEEIEIPELPMEGPFRQSIVFDERVNSPAFYGLERRPGDNLPFRWMGRTESGEVPVRLPSGRKVRVSAFMPIVINEAAFAGFTFGINGHFAEEYETERTSDGMAIKRAVFTVPGEPDGPLAPGRINLAAASRTDMSGKGDARLLAIGLHSLELEEVAEADAGETGIEADAENQPDGALRVLTAQKHFDHPAFYHLERRDDQMMFRWMGREDDQDFTVSIARDRPVRVTAHIAHAIDKAALEGFQIGIEDAFASDYELVLPPEGGAIKSATFTLANPAAQTPVRLQLRLKSKVDLSDRGDPRTLGVALSKIVVRQV
ncbi:hypothetical protein RDV64_23670 (plasmid) [Acuticoccus sp. MNP-M23]|uniref:hypothetical protein n=1 Tax=Acuticoccus sp. MNP-M23 TaxID=3072793 RepID=UPI002814ADF7|nr:hypothetical protein [Acuticoccus sp. MNP-M23]WMS45354.1 hypothetical protein RDV64_23670 [Acuticoccus sp. MNP-M23]